MRDICVIGDCFVDIIVPVDGLVPNGAHEREIYVFNGGTANVAVWMSRLGKKAGFFGKIGSDPLGYTFKKNLSEECVNDLTVQSDNYPTGICVSLVGASGSRSMITNRGVNDYLSVKEAKEFEEKIFDSNHLFFSGYSFISPQTSDAVEYLMNKALERECKVWFNPGALNIVNDKIRGIIDDYVNYLILNEDEGRALFSGLDEGKWFDKLQKSVETVVMTKGSKGCMVFEGNSRINVPPINVVEPIDTTGAGDAFAAGIIKGVLDGQTFEESAYLGHETAGKVLNVFGAR